MRDSEMTNEEAIKLLNNITSYCDFEDEYGDMIDSEPYYEAVDLAIKALEATDPSRFTMTETEGEDIQELLRTFQNQKVLVAEHDCLPSVTLLAEPCEDCISRRDALVILERAYEECKIGYTDYIEMRDAVKDTLSVKPQRAKGHWSDECECSVCGNQPWYEGSTFRKNYKFCPYCGADMRGDKE